MSRFGSDQKLHGKVLERLHFSSRARNSRIEVTLDRTGVWRSGAAAVNTATYARIARCGHMVHMEQPEALAALVKDFLRPA